MTGNHANLTREQRAARLGISIADFSELRAMSLNWGKTTAPSSFTGRVDRRWPSLFDRLKSSAAIKVDAERKVKRGASGDVMGVPDEVRVAFAGAPHLSMPQLAKAMRMDLKTLKGHRGGAESTGAYQGDRA
jgi:hypothetical protein